MCSPARQAGFVLRRRLGRLQVERAGRRAFGIGDEAEPGNPGDIGRFGIVDHQRVEADRPGFVGDGQSRRADEADGAGADGAGRIAIADLPERDQRLAFGRQGLEPDLPVLGVERSGDDAARLCARSGAQHRPRRW